MKNSKTKIPMLLIAAGLCCGQDVQAQQVQSAITQAPESKFYRLEIPQAFRSVIGNDLGKIRIRNLKKQVEVPFIIARETAQTSSFRPVKQSKTSSIKDSCTILVIENPQKDPKTTYTLRLANAELQKNYSMEGSNDSSAWFAISANEQLQMNRNSEKTHVEETINFPLNDYSYLRLTFNDKKAAPLNILAVGEYITTAGSTAWRRIGQHQFTQKNDKAKKYSLIDLHLAAEMPVDYIAFHIQQPKQFLREGQLYTQEEYIRKGKKLYTDQVKSTFTLQSGKQNSFPVHEFYAAQGYIRLENLDNEPLSIDSISLFQAPLYILADLEKGVSYALLADSSWNMPQYDLAQMEINTAQAPLLSVEELPIRPQIQQVKATKQSPYGKYILWAGLIAGILLVFFFSRGLLKDIKKGDDQGGQKP